jgi:hypothetical protein
LIALVKRVSRRLTLAIRIERPARCTARCCVSQMRAESRNGDVDVSLRHGLALDGP